MACIPLDWNYSSLVCCSKALTSLRSGTTACISLCWDWQGGVNHRYHVNGWNPHRKRTAAPISFRKTHGPAVAQKTEEDWAVLFYLYLCRAGCFSDDAGRQAFQFHLWVTECDLVDLTSNTTKAISVTRRSRILGFYPKPVGLCCFDLSFEDFTLCIWSIFTLTPLDPFLPT